MLTGPGDRRYRALTDWERLPAGWSYADVAGVAVDAQDRVYVLNRGQSPLGPEHPIIVFEPDGTFLRAFGDGLFTFAHGITVGPDGAVYVADAGDHTVRKFDASGALILTLGEPHRPSGTGYVGDDYRTIRRGGPPFNRPTRLALGADGDLFVSDGYGNAGSTASRRTAASVRPGASRATVPASSTSSTRSGRTSTAASSSATARTRASRSSTRTAAS